MADNEKHAMLQLRNSTNDFLAFTKETGGDGVNVLVADENVWLTQGSLCSLYDVAKSTISEHLATIFASGELDESSTVRKFRTVASNGKTYSYNYYNLQAIIAVGFKVNSERAVRFRAWASDKLADFAIKGYVLDKERLKNDRVFSESYFEKLLEDIREIRLSERKFYQKITDIYALSFDYDPKSKATIQFFQTVQNKLHFAIHGHTAAEIIMDRADATKDHMGLTTWDKAPGGKIRKSDVSIAKNYLSEEELQSLERKTYTYIKTMYELNKAYGWSKFIIVVPSVAIREGVFKTFQITQEHFAQEYGKKIRFFIYNSANLTDIDCFASDPNINAMIINSQAFNARGKDARRIRMKLDDFRSLRPIDILAKTNPVLIIDEPQSVEGKATKEGLKDFNPLVTLRYSATHRKDSIYNMVYRLDALDAYNQKLIKKIRVVGIAASGSTATESYVYPLSVNTFENRNTTSKHSLWDFF